MPIAALHRVAACLVLLAVLSACSSRHVGTDYAELATRPGDRVHGLSVTNLGPLRYVRADAVLIGDVKVQEHQLDRIDPPSARVSDDIQLFATPRAAQAIESTDVAPELERALDRYLDRLLSRSYALESGERPVFEVILLRQDEGAVISRTSWSLSGVRVPVLVQLDGSSHQSIAVSFARQMSILGHEWVHIGARGGRLTIPGSSSANSMLNEETFASLVQFCDRYENLLQPELDPALDITLHRIPSGNSDDADSRFQAIRKLGPSPAGTFLAGLILHQGLPTGVALDAPEIEALMRRCARLTDTPDNYVDRYVANGLPDEWDRYLRPR